MVTESRGKKFEQRFRKNWYDTVPDSMCYRLMDAMSGYSKIANVGDFINYKYPCIYIIDCKSHDGNTINFNDFSQYDKMKEYMGIKGVHAGTVCWFCEHDMVIWVPIETWHKIKEEGKKSFNIKMLNDPDYECILLPSQKKRTMLDTDYSYLINYYKEDTNDKSN